MRAQNCSGPPARFNCDDASPHGPDARIGPSTRLRRAPGCSDWHSLGDGGLAYCDSALYLPIWAYIMSVMPRAATPPDPFNAIAEPQRRRILTVLKGQESPVNDLASALRITPSLASKHLRVLREVGLVRVRGVGQHRLYGLDA